MIPIQGYAFLNPEIDWAEISGNESPEAVRLLEEYPQHIHWYHLSANSLAMDIIRRSPERISYSTLSRNHHPEAIRLLRNSGKPPAWYMLSTNPFAADWILETNEVRWPEIFRNPSTKIKHFIETQFRVNRQLEKDIPHPSEMVARETLRLGRNWSSWAAEMWKRDASSIRRLADKYTNTICRNEMSANPYFAEMLLHEYREFISWEYFSMNPNPIAVHYLLDHPEHLHLDYAVSNPHPSMVQYVCKHEKHPNFSGNTCSLALHNMAPVIYDYAAMRNAKSDVNAEIRMVALSPDYLRDLASRYGCTFEEIVKTRV